MSTSYQTDNTTEKDALVKEPSSTNTTMLKKVGVAAFVGALFVVGNSVGSTMNTPTTETEAFLSSISDLSVVDDGSIKCSGRSTMYSTAPLVSENTLPGEIICGQVCFLPEQVPFLIFAPKPTPVKGDCPSRGYTIDSGKAFEFLPGITAGRVFTKPPFAESAGATCESGYSPITSKWQDCKAAAVELGYRGDAVAFVDYMATTVNWPTWRSRPQGCFRSVDGGRVHFNNGSGGSGLAGDSIICSITK